MALAALGIDPGRRCGYTIADSGYVGRFRPRHALEGAGDNRGLWLGRRTLAPAGADRAVIYAGLWNLLAELHQKFHFGLIACESPGDGAFRNFKSAAAIWAVAGGVVVCQTFCRVHDVKFDTAQNLQVKKHATGSGAAEKDRMVEMGQRRGWANLDENAIDSAWLLDLVLTRWWGSAQKNRPATVLRAKTIR